MATLRDLRQKASLSQVELAKQAGLTAVTISRLENGRSKVQFQTLRRLAEVLGVTPEDISEIEIRRYPSLK